MSDTLTPEQRKHLKRLSRWPFRMWVSPVRYNAIFDGYEAMNRRAAIEARESAAAEMAVAGVAKQRGYYEKLERVTSYTGPDYRVRHPGQKTWIRATEKMYEQAGETGVQRSIGVSDLDPVQLQITA